MAAASDPSSPPQPVIAIAVAAVAARSRSLRAVLRPRALGSVFRLIAFSSRWPVADALTLPSRATPPLKHRYDATKTGNSDGQLAVLRSGSGQPGLLWCSRPARGSDRGPTVAARRRQATRRTCDPASARERGGVQRPSDRRAVGRFTSGDGG